MDKAFVATFRGEYRYLLDGRMFATDYDAAVYLRDEIGFDLKDAVKYMRLLQNECNQNCLMRLD